MAHPHLAATTRCASTVRISVGGRRSETARFLSGTGETLFRKLETVLHLRALTNTQPRLGVRPYQSSCVTMRRDLTGKISYLLPETAPSDVIN